MTQATRMLALGGLFAAALGFSMEPAPAVAESAPEAAPLSAVGVVQIAQAKEATLYRRLLAADNGGKVISVRGEDGRSVVKLKLVEGKTALEGGGKKKTPLKMSALKAGMTCQVTYQGETASKLACD